MKKILILLLTIACIASYAQPAKTKTVSNTKLAAQKFTALLTKFKTLCNKPDDKYIKSILADNLKKDKEFLSYWEIGINNSDAQIYHTLCAYKGLPYSIDSSNKKKIIATIPYIKRGNNKDDGSGSLLILPAKYLSGGLDNIYDSPLPDAKIIGKAKAGETYTYYSGTTAWSASMQLYLSDGFEYNGEGSIGYYAIVLDEATHKLGYISENATSVSIPEMVLQFINGVWKITALDYIVATE